MALVSGIPFAFSFFTEADWSWDIAKNRWQTQMLVLTGAMMVVHEFILWRGPLGVVNRGALKAGQSSILEIYKIRKLTMKWSIALWQGLLLGAKDALLGHNGHRRLFSKKPK